ncbi:BON domain-containing protein [Bradyrhizobium denitrificans]|uniref:BON domain-containing protein n=1 Tax=Bradyrhizobium denitrificans TaxID=2734912 RepID=UPI00289CD02D|nr:BON domain-containing protein [Bradyrhizobium sp. LMG 8443]
MVSLFRTDSTIKRDVEDEIKWDPSINDSSHIAVAVKDGVVTLTGFTKSYMDSYQAEKAARRVSGVKGIANDIQVKLSYERTDPEIAEEAVKAIKRELPSSSDSIRVVVKNGYLTLEGEAEWNYQKEWAERSVRSISGVNRSPISFKSSRASVRAMSSTRSKMLWCAVPRLMRTKSS